MAGRMQPEVTLEQGGSAHEGRVARAGLILAAWSETLVSRSVRVRVDRRGGRVRHWPAAAGEKPDELAIQAGKNFWTLVPFTMQMVMVIIGGYVVASAPLIRRAIHCTGGHSETPRGAIALVRLCATTCSLISWGLSPIFSGFLVREMTGRMKGLDYRAAGPAAYLGRVRCGRWAYRRRRRC